jgi:putative copper resistance protein D
VALTLFSVATRLVLYLTALGLFGVAASAHYAPAAFAHVHPRRVMKSAAATALLASVIGLGLLAAQMTDSASALLDPSMLATVATGTGAGLASLVRIAALALTLILLALPRLAAWQWKSVILPAGIAVASLAWSGHAASGEGLAGDLRLAADIAHLLAAGVWLGALAVFLRLVGGRAKPEPDLIHDSLAGFAGVGAGVVATLILTGVINVGLTLGWTGLATITATLWGRLLLLKLGLFAIMVFLAALNRFRLTPLLATADAPKLQSVQLDLRRSLILETTCAVGAVALVAWLGVLSPLPEG